MASGRELEKEGMGIAIQEMAKKGIKSYKTAGVELSFVPGVDKLRVRLAKSAEDTASTDASDDDEAGDLEPLEDDEEDDDSDRPDLGDDPDGDGEADS